MSDWDESKHPRVPGGKVNGGQFTDKELEAAAKAAQTAAVVRGVWDKKVKKWKNPEVEKIAMEKVREIADLDTERIVLINYETGEVTEINGDAEGVSMTPAERAKIPDSLFLHNHPGGDFWAKFSGNDLYYFENFNPQEAWLVAGDNVVVLKRRDRYVSWRGDAKYMMAGVQDEISKLFVERGITKKYTNRSINELDAGDEAIRNAIIRGYEAAGNDAYWIKWR